MSSSESEKVSQASSNTVPFVPPSLLLSVATVPMLLALVGGRALTEAMRELGELSEEIFRGDRLPVLHVPSATVAEPDNSTSV